MPQLDIVTFFSQFFWLCIFYMGFYYIVYKYFLPQYSRCILFRDRFTHSSITGRSASMEEKGNIEESLSMFTISAVGFSKNYFQESKNNTGDWYKFCYKETNEQDWKTSNLLYIKTFGAKQAFSFLSKNSISYTIGSSLYTEGLSKTLFFYNEGLKKKPYSRISSKDGTNKKSIASNTKQEKNPKNKSSAEKLNKTLQKGDEKKESGAFKVSKKNNALSTPKLGTRKSISSKK